MRRKFCFICGEKTDDLIDGRCKKCYNKGVSLIKVPKEIIITRCSKCNMFRFKNKWKKMTIKNMILDKIKICQKGVLVEVKESGIAYNVIATNGKREEHKVRTRINKSVCPICARKYTDYYEAVLQIRGKYNDEIMDFIADQLFMISKRDRKAFHTYHKLKEGVNIRLGSKSAAIKIADKLKKKYKCQIKKSYKLIGMKKGRTLYRDFISLRFS